MQTYHIIADNNDGPADSFIKSDPRLIFCRCISNIATGNHEQTGAVIRAVPALLRILLGNQITTGTTSSVSYPSLQKDACWAIGNIAGDSDEYRSALLYCGALQPVVEFLLQSLVQWNNAFETEAQDSATRDSAIELHENSACTAIWTISNIARGSTPGEVFLSAGTDFLRYLVVLLASSV